MVLVLFTIFDNSKKLSTNNFGALFFKYELAV